MEMNLASASHHWLEVLPTAPASCFSCLRPSALSFEGSLASNSLGLHRKLQGLATTNSALRSATSRHQDDGTSERLIKSPLTRLRSDRQAPVEEGFLRMPIGKFLKNPIG